VRRRSHARARARAHTHARTPPFSFPPHPSPSKTPPPPPTPLETPQIDTFHGKFQYLFIESICNDEAVLEANYRAKMRYSPDYAGLDPEVALTDFKSRIAKYLDVYEPIGDRRLHYIKVVDMVTGRGYMDVNRISGEWGLGSVGGSGQLGLVDGVFFLLRASAANRSAKTPPPPKKNGGAKLTDSPAHEPTHTHATHTPPQKTPNNNKNHPLPPPTPFIRLHPGQDRFFSDAGLQGRDDRGASAPHLADAARRERLQHVGAHRRGQRAFPSRAAVRADAAGGARVEAADDGRASERSGGGGGSDQRRGRGGGGGGGRGGGRGGEARGRRGRASPCAPVGVDVNAAAHDPDGQVFALSQAEVEGAG
jgi:hypothetical protein